MIKNITYLILICSLFSCKSLKDNQGIYGDYYKKGQDFEYALSLNRDNTFILKIKYQDANPTCVGKWEKVTDTEINLNCSEIENPTETISNGYMSEREHKIQVINNNSIKFKNEILKRK